MDLNNFPASWSLRLDKMSKSARKTALVYSIEKCVSQCVTVNVTQGLLRRGDGSKLLPSGAGGDFPIVGGDC